MILNGENRYFDHKNNLARNKQKIDNVFLNQIKNVNFGIFDNNHWLDDKSSAFIIYVNKIR